MSFNTHGFSMETYEQPGTEINDLKKLHSSSLVINKALLLILSPNFFGHTFKLNNEVVTIGRSMECDFIINDNLISKKHFLIIYEDNKFHITDNDSRNGTFLNGKLVKKKTSLFYGDKISVGSTIMRFYLEEELEK